MTQSNVRLAFMADRAAWPRVPWWAVILAYFLASLTVGIGIAGHMALRGDTFSTHGGAWAELGEMIYLTSGLCGAVTFPAFCVIRGLMIWRRWRPVGLYLLIWGLGLVTAVFSGLAGLPYWTVQAWAFLAEFALGPCLLAGLVQWQVERSFQR